jgi:hypothetical protein
MIGNSRFREFEEIRESMLAVALVNILVMIRNKGVTYSVESSRSRCCG